MTMTVNSVVHLTLLRFTHLRSSFRGRQLKQPCYDWLKTGTLYNAPMSATVTGLMTGQKREWY